MLQQQAARLPASPAPPAPASVNGKLSTSDVPLGSEIDSAAAPSAGKALEAYHSVAPDSFPCNLCWQADGCSHTSQVEISASCLPSGCRHMLVPGSAADGDLITNIHARQGWFRVAMHCDLGRTLISWKQCIAGVVHILLSRPAVGLPSSKRLQQ